MQLQNFCKKSIYMHIIIHNIIIVINQLMIASYFCTSHVTDLDPPIIYNYTKLFVFTVQTYVASYRIIIVTGPDFGK